MTGRSGMYQKLLVLLLAGSLSAILFACAAPTPGPVATSVDGVLKTGLQPKEQPAVASAPAITGSKPSPATGVNPAATNDLSPTAIEISWLREGNFWKVSWSEIEVNVTWTEKGGSYDVGTYSMKLGRPRENAGLRMYEILLSGDTEKYAPLWKWVGTDNHGNIYGSKSESQTPVLIHSVIDNDWSGSGFYTDFGGESSIEVNPNAKIIPSQYTKQVSIFAPPLTAVGYSSSDRKIYQGSGCDYFPGYGTICGSGPSSGPSTNEMYLEYWDSDAGPIAMHYAYNYKDCFATKCNEKHVEQRIEVWFFGDASSANIGFENEPDTYVDPTSIPVSESLFTMTGEVNKYDNPSGYISGHKAPVGMDIAAQIHDWYAFEITERDAKKTVDFYLFWNEADINLDFYLYAAPDNTSYGFLYLKEGGVFEGNKDFKRAKFLSGTYRPGKYLLGVIRTTDSEFATGYGIMSIQGDVTTP